MWLAVASASMPLHVFLQEAAHVGRRGRVEPVGHAPKRREIVFGSMHRRKLRDHRLDRGARVDERLQRQAARPGIGVDLLREQMVARTADDGAAVAAGMRPHESLRFENAQRLANRAAAELRLGSELAFGRQLVALHVLPAQDVPTQPFREHLGRFGSCTLSQPSSQRKWCTAATHGSVDAAAGQCSMVRPNKGLPR